MKTFVNARIATLAGPARPRVGDELRELGLVDRGSFSVENGRFVDSSGAGETVDLEGRLVLPGLVDAHTHLVFGGCRAGEFQMRCRGASYEDIAAAGGGIRSTVAATRSCHDEELLQVANRHAGWMLANGTTTAEAKSGYGLNLASERTILRTIHAVGEQTLLRTIPTFLGLHAVPPEFADADAYADHVIDAILPHVSSLATYADAFVEQAYFTSEQVSRYAIAAKAHGLKLRLHVDQLTDGKGAELAARLGAVTADHLEQTGQEGISALARAGVFPVLLPASVQCLGKSKYPDARAMIDAGLPVVLATDFNPGSSPTPSLPFAMHLACTQMGMSPAEAIVACTVNAAHSLDLGHEIGSIESGKSADFVVFDAEDPAELPYWVGVPNVYLVYARGRLAYRRALEE